MYNSYNFELISQKFYIIIRNTNDFSRDFSFTNISYRMFFISHSYLLWISKITILFDVFKIYIVEQLNTTLHYFLHINKINTLLRDIDDFQHILLCDNLFASPPSRIKLALNSSISFLVHIEAGNKKDTVHFHIARYRCFRLLFLILYRVHSFVVTVACIDDNVVLVVVLQASTVCLNKVHSLFTNLTKLIIEFSVDIANVYNSFNGKPHFSTISSSLICLTNN
ncbi:hypothetical protein AGLY_014970 [Aphis glycines]|uniref:Uncharacterized protein n=1 Tax=Aphis glycines TaxID=307491 RepID=A0A6G0T2P6_APHGL|nr:hypothetical protein AGLY_014970 [Aphis glycines]